MDSNLPVRACASRRWRWHSGLALENGDRVLVVHADELVVAREIPGGVLSRSVESSSAIPDLTDPLTDGWIFNLLREAYGPDVRVDRVSEARQKLSNAPHEARIVDVRHRWVVYVSMHVLAEDEDRLEAMVRALEAAP